MSYKYWLPDEQGNKQDFETDSNAIIIIGANGAGKSKLGAWIEQQDFEKVHRIAGQRNLNFNKNIPLKSYTEAENIVLCGNSIYEKSHQKGNRWGWHDNAHYTTTLLNDFEAVLAALIAKDNNQKTNFFDLCREAESLGNIKPNTPCTAFDQLHDIWHNVLPQRDLRISDAKFYADFTKEESLCSYSANEMSDGERAVLYLATQVLCLPENLIIIIDEPELHLHKSIMNRLWKSLERCRQDLLFIYITHDTQFASDHVQAEKIWIKEYDGVNWKFQKIDKEDLPEELLFEILGSRKNVLFVEGERNSYDTRLYTELYPDYHVVPCGSCTQVIARTKAFRVCSALHDCEVYGLIDRDFRSDYEIEKLKEDNIYTLQVAEVENLFAVEELVRFMANHMGKDSDEVFNSVKEYVIENRFSNQINGQVCESTVAQIKFKLSSAEISKKSETEAKDSLDAAFADIDYDAIKNEQESYYQDILSRKDYAETLKVFNAKSISSSIGNFFDINDKKYCERVISLLQGHNRDGIVSSIRPYLPHEIPR